MGYGEFGGGGSVHWRVVHGNGAGKGGRDGNPPEGGTIAVYINGVKVGEVDTDTSHIVVVWGSHLTTAPGEKPDKTNVDIDPYNPSTDEIPDPESQQRR
jgi:hypothetical protein